MEEFSFKKKRSRTSRRPRPDSQSPFAGQDRTSFSSTPPPYNDVSKVSSDENAGGDSNSRLKEFNHQNVSRVSPDNAFYDNEPVRIGSNGKRSSKGVLASANWKSTSNGKEFSELESRDVEIQSSVKKVKLKFGGVTRTIHANKITNGLLETGSSTRKNNH